MNTKKLETGRINNQEVQMMAPDLYIYAQYLQIEYCIKQIIDDRELYRLMLVLVEVPSHIKLIKNEKLQKLMQMYLKWRAEHTEKFILLSDAKFRSQIKKAIRKELGEIRAAEAIDI